MWYTACGLVHTYGVVTDQLCYIQLMIVYDNVISGVLFADAIFHGCI